MPRYWLLLVALVLFCRSTPAQLTLVMQVDSDPSGISLAGSGTASASLNFGTVQAFGGAMPPGVTRTVSANTWTVSTPIDVNVTKGSMDTVDQLSTSYTLTAQLQAADLNNVWKWNGQTLSTSAVTVTDTGTYGSTPSYSLNLTIPFSEAAGTVSNTIELMAVAN